MSPLHNKSLGLWLSEARTAISRAAWKATAAVARRVAWFPARMQNRKALAKREFSLPHGSPELSYGGGVENGKFVAGGQVKLLHLQNAFPERENFNILYLVSSALPPFATDLVNWARRQGVRVVWNQNGVAFPAWAKGKTKTLNREMAAILKLADHVVYQSEFCRESADIWLGKARCPSTVLYNPVDIREFTPPDRPQPVDAWQLLAAGTHHHSFRVLGALETLRVLRDRGRIAHLTVAGAMQWPDAETEVSEAIDRLQLSEYVTLRPAFSQQEAIKMYQRAHVLLHLKYNDPCPTVAIEAMSCGVPVVASRSGGMPELIGSDGGQLLEVSLGYETLSFPDPKSIAAAVETIMSDRTARSKAARQRAEQLFDSEKWIADHRKIFESLL